MRELGLRYKGKRCPFRFKNPRFEESLDFMSNDTVVWVTKKDADWLISNNPRMFEIMGEKGKAKGVEQVEKVVKVEPQPVDPPKPVVKTEIIGITKVEERPEEKPITKKKRGMPKGGWPSMKNKEWERTDDSRTGR